MTVGIRIGNEDARMLAELQPGRPTSSWTTSGGQALEVVANQDFDEKRWMMVMELVVKAEDGQLFRAFYERGLTENQEARPFEYDGDMIDFETVRAVEVTVTQYESADIPELSSVLPPATD